MQTQPIDVVFTWVDDSFDGYAAQLAKFAGTRHDSNPNRTRDNLNLLKYALRSVDQNLPEAGQVYLLTCRPQVPEWLNPDHPGITVVHHDEIMSPNILPTFNSFSIVSHLHKLPGLSERFLYVEDDMLFLNPGAMQALWKDGTPLSVFTRKTVRDLDALDATKEGPWNLALANANRALAQRSGGRKRCHIIHGPKPIVKSAYADMMEEFADEIAATRATRFRDASNVPPEYLYPHWAADRGIANVATDAESRRIEGYVSLENFRPWTWLQLTMMTRRKPLTATLNDSFEAAPNPRVERLVQDWLETQFPTPSRFER